jgi:hypothetical protein
MTVTSGVPDTQVRAIRDPDRSDSQADSASSILVTRSTIKRQVSGSRWALASGPMMPRRRLCAINVPARRHDDHRGATVVISLALLGLHMSVDRVGDGGIGAGRLMLVDDRGALTVVTHPGHQVFEPHTAPSRPRVPRVPEIVKCKPSVPIARTACGQDACLLKFPRRSGRPWDRGRPVRRDQQRRGSRRHLRRRWPGVSAGLCRCLARPARAGPRDRALRDQPGSGLRGWAAACAPRPDRPVLTSTCAMAAASFAASTACERHRPVTRQGISRARRSGETHYRRAGRVSASPTSTAILSSPAQRKG